MASDVRFADGTFDFSSGINGSRTPTVRSSNNPHGLKRDQLAWLSNGTVRDGGITQRTGWEPLIFSLALGGWWQGGYLYEPGSDLSPYLICSIAGVIYKVDLDAPFTITNLTTTFGLGNTHRPTLEMAFFAQGEEFLVIQAGDYGQGLPVIPGITDANGNTLPLFWDGATLTRSAGITNTAVAPGTPGVNFIPAGTCMVYYGDRLWYAQNNTVSAGDIVGGPSGTNFRKTNAILNVTENPLCVGGDGFSVPISDGTIRALTYPGNINTTLGQGPLLIGTRKSIYALTVPATRTDWINASSTNGPQIVVAQKKWGPVNDRSVVHVNGDVFYQTLEPSIRSYAYSVRQDQAWVNTGISQNENRILQFNNRSLLRFSSGMEFDNRLWQTAAPVLSPVGVYHSAVIPLDFDPLGSLDEKLPPCWEGHYEGLKHLQLFEGDFGGRQRAFTVVVNDDLTSIGIWEFTLDQTVDGGVDNDERVQWYAEFPALTWGSSIGEFELKELDGLEIWFDKIRGTVDITVSWRPDADPCWNKWFTTSFCAARTSCEDVNNPVCYPYPEQGFREGFVFPIAVPKPGTPCNSMLSRPANIGFQHQVKIEVEGWCRIRGIIVYALEKQRGSFDYLTCPKFLTFPQ